MAYEREHLSNKFEPSAAQRQAWVDFWERKQKLAYMEVTRACVCGTQSTMPRRDFARAGWKKRWSPRLPGTAVRVQIDVCPSCAEKKGR